MKLAELKALLYRLGRALKEERERARQRLALKLHGAGAPPRA